MLSIIFQNTLHHENIFNKWLWVFVYSKIYWTSKWLIKYSAMHPLIYFFLICHKIEGIWCREFFTRVLVRIFGGAHSQADWFVHIPLPGPFSTYFLCWSFPFQLSINMWMKNKNKNKVINNICSLRLGENDVYNNKITLHCTDI